MRIAVHNPRFFAEEPLRNYNGYNLAFVRLFKPIIYLSGIYRLRFSRIVRQMAACGLNPQEFTFLFTEKHLRAQADVLLSFTGFPTMRGNAPVKNFAGLKIYHAFEYVFDAVDAAKSFQEGGVDYLMGYANHGKYCPFFQHVYAAFTEKVIPVAFGFSQRFQVQNPFLERVQKVVALGAVNPVNDPLAARFGDLSAYVNFYKEVEWTHQWRRMLFEQQESLRDIMDSFLPAYPQTKNMQYDAVAMLNNYALFANDEGLMNFPPARTFEGMACGAVLVCADNPVYAALGLKDGENCLMHPRHDINEFRHKITDALANPQALHALQQRSVAFAQENFTHDAVAQKLYADIAARYGASSYTNPLKFPKIRRASRAARNVEILPEYGEAQRSQYTGI